MSDEPRFVVGVDFGKPGEFGAVSVIEVRTGAQVWSQTFDSRMTALDLNTWISQHPELASFKFFHE